LIADAREALHKYGETLDIRRDSLQPLLHGVGEVPVQRVRLFYEGGRLKPRNTNTLSIAMREAVSAVPGVEILFQ
jgi:CBS-domain-containing membrane protein